VHNDGNHPIIHNRTDKSCPDNIDFSPIRVCSALSSLKSGSSAGPDGIPANCIKRQSHKLCEPLSYIFSRSYLAGVLPDDWLHATVNPIFKKMKTQCL
jgi:hypothetical protein